VICNFSPCLSCPLRSLRQYPALKNAEFLYPSTGSITSRSDEFRHILVYPAFPFHQGTRDAHLHDGDLQLEQGLCLHLFIRRGGLLVLASTAVLPVRIAGSLDTNIPCLVLLVVLCSLLPLFACFCCSSIAFAAPQSHSLLVA
jgi:hypothetical protein